jgi:hypothetical protein
MVSRDLLLKEKAVYESPGINKFKRLDSEHRLSM